MLTQAGALLGQKDFDRQLAAAPLYVAGDRNPHWRAGGIMLQMTPDSAKQGIETKSDDWERLTLLLKTVEDLELVDTSLAPETLLWRLFNQDEVRVQPPETVIFRCDCNADRITQVLKSYAAAERAGLADPARMATAFPDLDLWHPWDIDTAEAIALGQQIEAAGRAHAGITNSDGAGVGTGTSLSVYANSHGFVGAERASHANSHGFVGRERSTRHALSLSLIAGEGEGMQRDYWYDSVRAPGDFISANLPASIVSTPGTISGHSSITLMTFSFLWWTSAAFLICIKLNSSRLSSFR